MGRTISHITRHSRVGFLFAAMFVMLLCNSTNGLANTSVQTGFVAEYGTAAGVGAFNCAGCHNLNDGSTLATFGAGKPVFFRDLFQQMNPGGTAPPGGRLEAEYRSQMRALANRIDRQYSPNLSGLPSPVTVNKATFSSLPINVSPGKNIDGANDGSPTLSITGVSPTNPGFTLGGSGLSRTLSLPGSKPLKNLFSPITVSLRSVASQGFVCQPSSFCEKTITLNLTNSPARLAVTGFPVARIGQTVTIDLNFIDDDGDDVVFCQTPSCALVDPAGLGTASTVSPAGVFTYTLPPATPSNFSETLQVSLFEGPLTVGPLSFTITAEAGQNNPPTTPATTDFTIDEDKPFTGAIVASDPDGDPLTFTVLMPPAHGTFDLQADGNFTYTPGPNNSAPVFVEYRVADPAGAFATGRLNFTITADDDPPLVKPPKAFSLADLGLADPINVVSGEQKTVAIDLKQLVVDPDTPANQLKYTITRYLDNETGPTGSSTFGTFSPVSANGNVPGGSFTYVNRKDVALNFTVEFGVSNASAAPPAGECTPSPTIDCGTIKIEVLLNGRGRHTTDDRITLAQQLGDKYFTIPGNSPHFPETEAQGACLNCHTPGKVTTPAPSCDAGFFNALGARICRIRPFQADFGSRVNDAITGTLLNLPQFEPSVNSPQGFVDVSETEALGADVGLPFNFTPGLNLVDGLPATVINAYIKEDNAREFFDIAILDNGARGQLKIKKSLRDFIGGQRLSITPLPVNNGARGPGGANTGGAGFYPSLILPNALTINIIRQRPIVENDGPFLTNVKTPIEMDVLANDAKGGRATGITSISAATKGTVTDIGGKLRYVPNGQTGKDSFTYKATGPGGESQDAATVEIEIFDETVPVAQPDSVIATINTTTRIDVLANDLGPKPDRLSIEPGNGPQNGKAVVTGNLIEYTPNAVGSDSFIYTVEGGGQRTSAKVSITISDVSGEALAKGTDNPLLKPVAFAMGESCKQIQQGGGPRSADQADLVAMCSALIKDIGAAGAIDAALDAIRNEEVLAAGDAAMQHDRATQGNIMGRLDAIRGGGGRGLTFSQFTLQLDDASLPGSLIDSSIKAAGMSDTIIGGENNPWGVFVAGTVTLATQDGSEREAEFESGSLDLTTGIDYALNEKTLIGLAVSYGHSSADFSAGGSLETEAVQIALYGSFQPSEQFMIDGYAGYAFSDHDLSRVIAFSTSTTGAINRLASGSFDGDQFSAAARLKYLQSFEALDVETYAMLNYLSVWTGAYTETGAGGLSLAVGEQNFDTLAGTLGLRVSRKFPTYFGAVTPYAGGAYAHQFISDRRSVTSSFAAAGLGATVFSVASDADGENLGSFELGFDAEATGEFSFSMGLAGTFSDGGFEGYAVKAGLQIPF